MRLYERMSFMKYLTFPQTKTPAESGTMFGKNKNTRYLVLAHEKKGESIF